ncbi:MAG TPA: hypothetical protein V6C88_03560, partial [Chroococcidiopsis sp.]
YYPAHQQQPQQPAQPQPLPERNKGRGYRRAGNACEIAAGAALNSGVVFVFHLMQIHPIGFVVALGVSHFYFTATAFGEGRDRFLVNTMTGCSALTALLCSLSEPVGEWWEASQSRTAALQDIDLLYPPPPQPRGVFASEWVWIFGAVLLLLLFAGGRRDR